MQSTFSNLKSSIHAAIIMDGNGRWAGRLGSPRHYGHHAGAKAVRRVIEAAPGLGVTTLTLYAFSSDNWERPAEEVVSLLRLLGTCLIRELASCRQHGVRVNVIGRRDRLPRGLVRLVERTEAETRSGQRLHLSPAPGRWPDDSERNLRGFDRLCASCGSQDPADTEASMLESQPGPESAMIHW